MNVTADYLPLNWSMTTHSSSKALSENSYRVLDYFNLVIMPLALVVGIIGNLITIIVMNTTRFSHFGSRYFLVGLAIADMSVIITQPMKNMFVIKLIGFDLRSVSLVGCKIYFLVHRMGKMMSSWFVVWMAVERLTAIRAPFAVKKWFSRRNIFIGIAMMSLIIGSFCAGYSYCTKIDQNGICNPDVYDKNDTEAVTLFRHMLNTGVTLYFLGPLVILLIVIPAIIISLLKIQRDRTTMAKVNTKSIVIRPTTMLLTVMVAYILSVTPIGIVRIIVNYSGVNLFAVNMTWFSTFRDVAHVLEIINYAINFFLYVCSSLDFRKGVLELIFSTRRRRGGGSIRDSR